MKSRVSAIQTMYLALLASIACGQGLPSSSSRDEAALLVAQLGDHRFAVRERATSMLITLGAPAQDALEKGASSVDREIRYRSRTVLTIIRDLDFQERLSKFARDPDLGNAHGLPGWGRFRDLVGDDRSAKPLFVGMYRAEPSLMRSSDASPLQVGKVLDRRCIELKQSVQLLRIRHSANRVAVLLFLAGNEAVPLNAPTNMTLYVFCQQTDVRAAVLGPSKRPFRKLLAQWLSRRQNNLARDAMMLGMQFEIHEVLPRARRTAIDFAAKAYDRQFAILAIAKFGGEAELPLLEQLLDDKLVCTEIRRRNAQISVQIRDTALAALLHLTKRDFAEFAYPSLKLEPRFVFALPTLGFEHDEQRQSAIAKWQEWRKKE